MRLPRLTCRLTCLALLALLAAVPRIDTAWAETRLPELPHAIPQRRAEILQLARRTWRRDAVVTAIRLAWAPSGMHVTPKFIWLEFTLYSPSNRHRAFVTQLRGEDDGAIRETTDQDSDVQPDAEIPDFAIDLPAAIVIARTSGMQDDISTLSLAVREPRGHRPVLAWVIDTGSRSFPFAVDAQTGRDLPWQDVQNPPQWTDEEMRTAMYRFIHRNDPPPPASAGGGGGGCFAGVEVMYGMCMDSGGSYVDPYTGK